MENRISKVLIIIMIMSLFTMTYAEDNKSYILSDEEKKILTIEAKEAYDEGWVEDCVAVAKVRYRLFTSKVKEDYVIRPYFFKDESKDISLITDRIKSLYSRDIAVIEIEAVNGVDIADTEWSQYAGYITEDKKNNNAHGALSEHEKNLDNHYYKEIDGHKVWIGYKKRIDEMIENDGFRVLINDRVLKLQTEPYIKNDRMMIPFRAIFEELGADVDYDFTQEKKRVWATRKNVRVEMAISDFNANRDGEIITMDVTPEIFNDSTYIPLRYASELLGCEVIWAGEYRTVVILTETYKYD